MSLFKDVDNLRRIKKVTLSTLSHSVGTSVSNLSSYLSGKSDIGSVKLGKLLLELNLSLEDIVKIRISDELGLKNNNETEVIKQIKVIYENMDDMSKKTLLKTIIGFSTKLESDECNKAREFLKSLVVSI